jgi:hypothetical protein
MNQMFRDVYPDVRVPKSVWRWIDSAQHRLAAAGAVRALSVVDLLICGTAAATDLVVLLTTPTTNSPRATFPTSERSASFAPTSSGCLVGYGFWPRATTLSVPDGTFGRDRGRGREQT